MKTTTPLILLLCLAGCRSSEVDRDLDHLHTQHRESYRAPQETVEEIAENTRNEGGRRDRVLELLDEGRIRTPVEFYYAADVLVTSNDLGTLELARDLAYSAAEAGEEERALPIAAHATDKILLRRQLPQRFGTQIVYDALFGRWELYELDVNVTDDDRAAMYVPPIEKQLERVARLNQPELLEAMHGER